MRISDWSSDVCSSDLIYDPEIDLCIHYGHGSWGDCWSRHWSDLELFPVASPTLLNARPLSSIRDLTDHVILHADDGREWQTWLAAAKALELGSGRSDERREGKECVIQSRVRGSRERSK